MLPAFLFCAGFGARMKPLTDACPKPLIEVAGRPLASHALSLVEDAEIARRVGNVHYRADQMARWLDAHDVVASREHPDILDTGGGLKAALPLLDAPACHALNTDAVWSGANPLRALRRAWNPEEMDALLALVPRSRATGHRGAGDFTRSRDGRLARGRDYVYTGAQIVATAPVAARPETVFSMNVIWDGAAASGRLFGLIHDGDWCDVGRPDAIALAEAMLAHA